ncbi:hypothetical protein [Allorhodopirellula solitaria]|nr:hypothetical protein [Allorhodopirellula solitaria]
MARNKSQNKQKKKKQSKTPKPRRKRPTRAAAVTVDQKLSRVRPNAYPDETAEDRAVFDAHALAKLPPETADQVKLVREALELVAMGQDVDAEQKLSGIPRRSPLSDWRLFVRGLTQWYRGETDAAAATFARLDPDRRPGRIAETLRHADTLPADSPPSEAPPTAESECDPVLVSGAKLVHRIRCERADLEAAKKELTRPEQLPDAEDIDIPEGFPGPRQLQWLLEFSQSSLRHEPELVFTLFNNLVRFVASTPLASLLDSVTERVNGPSYDPSHDLLRSLYYRKFEDAEAEIESFRKKYIASLKNNRSVPPPVARALEAELFLMAARDEQEFDSPMQMFPFGMQEAADGQLINQYFTAATKAYPAHAEAHSEYVGWLRSQADVRNQTKAKQKAIATDLAVAMQHWAAGCPDAIEPRLWLVDYFLENEELERAEPHVRFLADSRNVDLRVQATQWKWHLLEAMRLCRRKAWMHGAEEQLDAAEKIWPLWLSRDWLPYLHAALAIRRGDTDRYETLRQQIRDSWKTDCVDDYRLADAVMMLGAAQRMRVPAAELKPLRQPVEEALKGRENLSNTALLRAGHFFVELFRAGLVYPAYRMHGSKFADELVARLRGGQLRKGADTEGPDFWPAIFWLAQSRVFYENSKVRLPQVLMQLDAPEKIAAIIVHTDVERSSRWLSDASGELLDELEAAIPEETDTYLKYWYKQVLTKAKEKQAASESSLFGGGILDRIAAMMSDHELDNEDEDEDY